MEVYAPMFNILFIQSLIGMLFLTLEARGEECCTPTASTFLAVNTNRGAQLVYKNSDSRNINNITFDGLYLSSAKACGMNYQRCPNLTVIMDGNVVVVVMPLQEHFGLVTYDKNDNHFSFREQFAININLECEISSISEYFPSKLTVIGSCLYTETNMVGLVYVIINSSSLSESSYFSEQSCSIHSPSEFVFMVSATFLMGVSVYIDNGQVRYQRYGEDCRRFDEISVCSDVHRFTSVPPDLQAIYCESATYLLDLVSLPVFKIFKRDNDGFPFFCSKHAYYTYKDGNISFHRTTNKTQIGSAVPISFLFNKKDVVWGDCVNGMFVVIQSTEGEVISLTVNTRKVNFVGHSQTIPRIFGMTVLLNNLTHALVYDLQTSTLIDVIKQEFMMGYVVSDYDLCMTCVLKEPQKKSSSILAVIISLIVVILLVSFAIGCYIYCKKKDSRVKKKRSRLHNRPLAIRSGEDQLSSSSEDILVKSDLELTNADSFSKYANGSDQPQCVAVNADNPPKLDLTDSNIIQEEYANGSGQPQCVAVNTDNPPKLDLTDSNMIQEEYANGSCQPQCVAVDNSPELDPAGSSMIIRQESANGSGQLVSGNGLWPSSGGATPTFNNLLEPSTSASNNLLEPSTPASNNLLEPSAPASNNLLEPSAPANAQQQVINFQDTQVMQAYLHYGGNLEVNALAQVDANGSARSNQQLELDVL